MRRLSHDEFCASTGRRLCASERDTVVFLELEMRETRRRLGACVSVRGAHFEHEF